MEINVTTPESMTSYDANDVVAKFEKQFKKEKKDQEYYHLVISGEYPRYILDRIQKIYKNAGWKDVVCHTSSENGERAGLTGLQLYR